MFCKMQDPIPETDWATTWEPWGPIRRSYKMSMGGKMRYDHDLMEPGCPHD